MCGYAPRSRVTLQVSARPDRRGEYQRYGAQDGRALRTGRRHRRRVRGHRAFRAAATGSPTSSPTTCPSWSSTKRTSPGGTRRPRPRRTASGCGRGSPWWCSRTPSSSTAEPFWAAPCPSSRSPTADQIFPPADDLWAWAHVHVNGKLGGNPADHVDMAARLAATVGADRDSAYSRLLCPRILKPNTGYHAFVIPTFESGRLAGIGKDPSGATFATQSAWATGRADADAALYPVYHRWYFRTGKRGRLRIPGATAEATDGRSARGASPHRRSGSRRQPSRHSRVGRHPAPGRCAARAVVHAERRGPGRVHRVRGVGPAQSPCLPA